MRFCSGYNRVEDGTGDAALNNNATERRHAGDGLVIVQGIEIAADLGK